MDSHHLQIPEVRRMTIGDTDSIWDYTTELEEKYELNFKWKQRQLNLELNESFSDLSRLSIISNQESARGSQFDSRLSTRKNGSSSSQEESKIQTQNNIYQNEVIETEIGSFRLKGCIAVMNDEFDINKREINYYLRFRSEMKGLYDSDNMEHEFNLQQLYVKVFNQEAILTHTNDQGLSLITEQWKDIGFQAKDARTDFRGSGHLGLLCLIYMVENYRDEFDVLAKCTKEEQNLMWLTAVTSINVTHSLLIYLHFNQEYVRPELSKLRAGRSQFKKFCKLNSICKKTFFELNCYGLRDVYKKWRKLIKKIKDDDIIGLMGSFGKAMDQSKQEIHSLLSERISDFTHLVNRIQVKLQE